MALKVWDTRIISATSGRSGFFLGKTDNVKLIDTHKLLFFKNNHNRKL